MIVPSVDIMGGKAVQLIGGREKVLEVDNAVAVAERFGVVGEVAVIDLDAALSFGDNQALVRAISKRVRCRVGGGLRSVSSAIAALDAGADKVILGTQAVPEILTQLPRSRVIAALDAENGEIVVQGWRTKTGKSILDQMQLLRDYVGGFLVTFVEREGQLGGTRLDLAAELVQAAGSARVTIAGGITTAEEIRELDQMGADAQVGMALYTGRLDLAEAFAAPLRASGKEPLWPTVVCDEHGVALGMCWSNKESLDRAINSGTGVYHSRKRGLWEKGKTSGNTQQLLRVDLDCDRDTLRFTVAQSGTGFCHNPTYTCWGDVQTLSGLERRLQAAAAGSDEKSYTKRLMGDAELLNSKLREEALELTRATSSEEIIAESADVFYFTLAKLASAGVSLSSVVSELSQRTLKVTRRDGDAKA